MNPDENEARSQERARSRRNLLFGMLALAAVILLYAYTQRPIAMPPGWGEDLATAREQAAREGRPIFLEFGASWCPPCRRMAREILPNPRVVEALKGFICAHVDVDKHAALAAEYHVESLPTFVVLDPAGRQIHRFEGGLGVEEFLAQLARIPWPADAADGER